MRVIFTKEAYKDFQFWKENNQKKHKRIKALILDIEKNKHRGIGKPEALKCELSGFYSRRIDKQNRLVYRINKNKIEIISCRYHY